MNPESGYQTRIHPIAEGIFEASYRLPSGYCKGFAPRWNRTNNPVIESHSDLFFMRQLVEAVQNFLYSRTTSLACLSVRSPR